MEKYEELLDEIGFKINLSGYFYWVEAIRHCTEDLDSIGYNFDMSELYQYIAKKFKTSVSKAERCMRNAWQVIPNLSEKLKVDYKLNNGVILALLVRKIKRSR